MKKKKIALIGLGYLGNYLADSLIKLGFDITATKTTQPTLNSNNRIKYLQLNIEKLTELDPIPKEILEADFLIYNIPPKAPEHVENFFNNLNPNQKIIYTSSTSVYGKNMGSIDENTPIPFPSLNAPIVLELEILAKKYFKNLALLRFGGLYGNTPYQKRHPITFLAGKKDLKTGHEYLHLVHVNDCANAIIKIIEKDLFPIEINIISDLRILKKDYYINLAMKCHLPLPIYTNEIILDATQISNQKSIALLGLKYHNPAEYSLDELLAKISNSH